MDFDHLVIKDRSVDHRVLTPDMCNICIYLNSVAYNKSCRGVCITNSVLVDLGIRSSCAIEQRTGGNPNLIGMSENHSVDV